LPPRGIAYLLVYVITDMMSIILPLLSLLVLAASQEECLPFGTRIQYGQQLVDPTSTHKISISFNTPTPCPNSFLRILSLSGFTQVACTSMPIVSRDMKGFITYVQRCDLHTQVPYDQSFNYNVYGWDKSS
jgi:hypothetical protein